MVNTFNQVMPSMTDADWKRLDLHNSANMLRGSIESYQELTKGFKEGYFIYPYADYSEAIVNYTAQLEVIVKKLKKLEGVK